MARRVGTPAVANTTLSIDRLYLSELTIWMNFPYGRPRVDVLSRLQPSTTVWGRYLTRASVRLV